MFKQWIWCLKYHLWPVEELLSVNFNTQTLANFTGGRHVILVVFKAWPTWGWKTVPPLHLPSHGPQMDRNTHTHGWANGKQHISGKFQSSFELFFVLERPTIKITFHSEEYYPVLSGCIIWCLFKLIISCYKSPQFISREMKMKTKW